MRYPRLLGAAIDVLTELLDLKGLGLRVTVVDNGVMGYILLGY